MAGETDMKGSGHGPLAGIKVLEITQMVAGPLAGVILADLGASVVKVESLRGDPLRHVRPQYKGMCAHFFAINRGKRSIALDLKSEVGRTSHNPSPLNAMSCWSMRGLLRCSGLASTKNGCTRTIPL